MSERRPSDGATPAGSREVETRIRELLALRPADLHGDLDARLPPGLQAESLLAAAVLVLLERQPGYGMVFTKRTQTVLHHKGEISFPGGMRDPGDDDLRATGLREAFEELGVRPADVTVLGELDRLVTVTGFVVTPIVAVIDAAYAYRPNPSEVERVLLVPLSHLRDPSNWFEEDREWQGRPYRLRSCRFEDDVIWGATSRMLQNFLAVVPAELL